MAEGRPGRRHPAQHDALTGLAHRGLGHARLDAALEAARVHGGALAVAMLDLERFHALNAALGHAVGDGVLQAVAQRLVRAAAPQDTVARFGSDEFFVLLVRQDEALAFRDALALADGLARGVEIAGLRIPLRVRTGIALHPAHGADGATLLRRADLALQQAKREGRAHVVYEAGHDEAQLRKLAIVHALRDAVAGRQLRLEYQPKLDLRTRTVTQAEALLRWRHPAIGALPPDEFIPLAEQSGQIQPLTRWVLAEVLRQASAWSAGGLQLGLAVNLSALDLRALDLPAALGALLSRSGFDPARLTLEITETAWMRQADETASVLQALRGLGVRLALDDFGVGFSSLSRLRFLPVDELKLDRSFVTGLRAGTRSARIVESILALGHGLGLRVVAEGVESLEELHVLETLGCDVVQGYFLSPPLTPEALAGFCQARRGLRRVRTRQTGAPSRTRSASA